MILTLTGKLKRTEETVVVSDKFKKRVFVIETDGEYPQVIELQLTQDRVDLIDAHKVGDDLSINFNVRGREWTSPKDNQVKVFNTIEAWKIDKAGAAPSQAPQAAGVEDEDDSLPF